MASLLRRVKPVHHDVLVLHVWLQDNRREVWLVDSVRKPLQRHHKPHVSSSFATAATGVEKTQRRAREGHPSATDLGLKAEPGMLLIASAILARIPVQEVPGCTSARSSWRSNISNGGQFGPLWRRKGTRQRRIRRGTGIGRGDGGHDRSAAAGGYAL